MSELWRGRRNPVGGSRRGLRWRGRAFLTIAVAAMLGMSVMGTAGPAASEPPSNTSPDRFSAQSYLPFISSSELEVTSMGGGRASVDLAKVEWSVRNPASKSVKRLFTQAELDAAMKKALRNYVFKPKPDPVPDDVLREIDEVTAIAGAAPIIGRLPVAFDTFAVGKSFREPRKLDESMWKGVSFPHGSNDPAIAAASKNVFAAIAANSELADRSTDMGLVYSAVDAVRSGSEKPAASGLVVTGAQSFAQLGVTPFVRIFATRSEVVDLYDRGLIVGINLDSAGGLDLDESTEWIESDRYQAPHSSRQWEPALRRNANGRGVTVAVLDSGVDIDHPTFRNGAIVDGACFIACDGEANPATTVTTVASANHCSLSATTRCDHGTHVAAIIAGTAATLPNGQITPTGVAPAARIAAYRTGAPNADGTGLSFASSNAIQGLGRATTQAASLNIVAANLSHGTTNRYQVCPAAGVPLNDPAFATAVGVASAAGISVINSNGNASRFSWGACDPTMIVVANVQKDGTPASSSNFHSAQTTLWAPGTDIWAASVDDTGAAVAEIKSGTSMAAPHVAGSVALIAQAVNDYNSAQNAANQVTRAQVQNLMLGIAATDPGRVLIWDTRTGTDDQGNNASSLPAPLLSLRNLWMLLAGGPLPQQTTVPVYTPTFNTGIVNGTPREWTVTSDPVRREYASGATPFRSRSVSTSIGTWNLGGLASGRLSMNLVGRTFLDGPYLTIHVKNGTVASAVDGSGNAMTIERIANGPQPCTRAGWIETVRIPISPSQADAGGNGPTVRFEGPGPQAMVTVEGTLASGDTFAVSTDPRPLVFGGGRTFPDSVNLGAHRPDLSTVRTRVPWFDLDRISGDERMIDDSFYAGSFSTLSGTRVPNDAVNQDFFNAPQMASTVGLPTRSPSGVIGWNESPGIQDCAVALGHYWWGS